MQSERNMFGQEPNPDLCQSPWNQQQPHFAGWLQPCTAATTEELEPEEGGREEGPTFLL